MDCESHQSLEMKLIQQCLGTSEIREFQHSILKQRTISQDTDDDNDEEDDMNLSPSLVFYLRVQCSTPTTDLSDIIHDIPTLCHILHIHLNKLIEFNKLDDDELEMTPEEAAVYEDNQNFTCLQLIHMAQSSNMEEGSRRHFNSLMRSMLSRLETPDDLVEACLKAMAKAHDTESQFVQTVSEILVDVEDDDSSNSSFGRANEEEGTKNEKAQRIVRQMRIIAILSIVLEHISSSMVGHPILDGFLIHLSPAITSKNAVVREHGVICLAKFCLLSEHEKVMNQFRPLLMTIARSSEERAEVRVQAVMALCDLALIHDEMLDDPASSSSIAEGEQDGEEPASSSHSNSSSSTFKDLLIEMLGHPKPLIVAIAAEISAKLLLAGRFHDPILVGWLVAVYFDSSKIVDAESSSSADDEIGAEDIGSPVRLQQLLSLFFPTYSMSCLDANDAIMASVGPLLEIVHFKMEGMKQKKALEQWPVAKMVEYICYIVDIADKTKKSEEKADSTEMDENDVEPTEAGSVVDEMTEGANEKNHIIEASSTLLASIDIAEYLAEFSSHIPAWYTRAISKILGSASIDVTTEDMALLKRLKTQVTEAEYSIDDGPSLTAIRKLSKVLEHIDEEADENEASAIEDDEEEEEEIAETLEKVKLVDSEKENPRLSTGTVGSQISSKSRGRESMSSRVSLGSVN